MKKVSRRRPELESLESLTLLSGVEGVVHGHPAVPATVVTTASRAHPLTLQGTIAAKSLVTTKRDGTTATISGSGTLRPIGPITLSGTLNFDAQGRQTSGALILVSRGSNKLLANLEQSAPGSNQFQYTITGGIKAFLYASGSGKATLQTHSAGAPTQQGAGFQPGHSRLSITFD
jgi:hypothetical protein